MIKEKTYRYDDNFKAKARKHQFDFRENELNDFYDEKNPQVILTPDAAKKGLIFCDTYREFIRTKVKSFKATALFSNMLRSEHIPYNIFTPMEMDLEASVSLFNEIIRGGISSITEIKIEFAGDGEKDEYLNDGTSFDAFIKYTTVDGKKGGIGIEVKYTEKEYRIGDIEEKAIANATSKYHQKTKESRYFVSSLDVLSFIKANHLRQIWRNHILGYSMLQRGDIQHFHHIHLYPKGNEHFHDFAIPEYRKLLTEKGHETFIALTFEELFALLSKYFTSPKQVEWQDYLRRRYIVS